MKYRNHYEIGDYPQKHWLKLLVTAKEFKTLKWIWIHTGTCRRKTPPEKRKKENKWKHETGDIYKYTREHSMKTHTREKLIN